MEQIDTIKEAIWLQFGAAIDQLEDVIQLCPADKWNSKSEFWYISYHALFWLDYYLSNDPDNFHPPKPFTLSEFDPSGIIPETVYSKETLIDYLNYSRNNCHNIIYKINEHNILARFISKFKNFSRIECLLYNMRHVQHHAAQLNLILRQEIDTAAPWVSQARAIE